MSNNARETLFFNTANRGFTVDIVNLSLRILFGHFFRFLPPPTIQSLRTLKPDFRIPSQISGAQILNLEVNVPGTADLQGSGTLVRFLA